jgi:glycerol-3-phosphate acyltransferase PlsY
VTAALSYAAALAAGYLLGAVSPATLVARRAGADLRLSGSGNPGATNVGRVLGRRSGVVVGVLDVVKGLLPAALFGVLVSHRAGLVAGLAAVLGHVTSPYLHGRGGKGVATAAGAALGSHPLWAPFVLLGWVGVFAVTRWVALASVAAALLVVVVALLARAPGFDVAWAVLLAAIVLLRHRVNFARWWRARSTGP